jgi:pimeloyl-ACP methyl ester carboxylesterase
MLRRTFISDGAVAGGTLMTPGLAVALTDASTGAMAKTSADLKTGFAPVNGLRMYYEIHGTGPPLLVRHGAFMNIELMGQLVPELARSRQVIAVEFQGHGHTPDIDRPLSYEHLADDTAALLQYAGVDAADVYRYSLGGGVALQLAFRHPNLVRKQVIGRPITGTDGMYHELLAAIAHLTPNVFDTRGPCLARG